MSHHRVTNPDIEGDIPGEVLQFLKEFDTSLKAKDVPALQSLYETTLPQLSGQFYSNKVLRGQDRQPFRAWPAVKFVKHLFTSDSMEKIYTMVYYRHLFTDRSVSSNVRVKSWETFKNLIDVLIKASQSKENSNDAIDLPNGLLWDIFDEMLFQLQSLYNQKSRSITQGKDWPAGTWDIQGLLNLFNTIIEKTNTVANLGKVTDPASFLTVNGPQHIANALGVFAMVAKMRLNVMLGDYIGALDDLEPLSIFTKGRAITTQAAPCHVAVFYNVGFCYMMLRRYSDAVTTLKYALQVKAANRVYVDSVQAHVVSLITMSATLGCLSVEDVATGFGVDRTRQEEDAQLLGGGDLTRYREMFWKACPKFLSVVDHNSTTYTESSGQEGKDLQLRVFMRAVQQQVDALKLRGYLRVYATINGAKIQSLLTSSTQDAAGSTGGSNAQFLANAHLACLKHKSSEKVHDQAAASPNAGEFKSTAAIDFGVKVDHVTVVQRKHTETPSRRFVTLLNQLKD